MKEKLLSKSKRSLTNLVIIFGGILMFCFFIFLVQNNYQPRNNYEVKAKIFGFVIIFIVILSCIYYLLNLKTIYVYKDFLEIKNVFRSKKYDFTEFRTSYFQKIDGKYNSYTQYYLVLHSGEKLKFNDSEFGNFDVFFPLILQKINIDENYNKELSKPKYMEYAIICGVISLLFLGFSITFYDFEEKNKNDFIYISDVVTSHFRLTKQSRASDYYEFKISNYPDFNFRIFNDETLDDFNLKENFKIGSTITIGIDKYEYESKIAKSKPLSFIDKYLRYYEINVNQIKDSHNLDYIDLNILNKNRKESNYIWIGMLSFFGLLFLIFAAGNYNAYRKSKKNP